MAAYRRALVLRPEYADVHNNLGCLLREQEEPEAAEAAFRRAVEIDPAHVAALDNLGEALRDMGRPEEARQAFQQSLALAERAGTRVRSALLGPVVPRSTAEIIDSRSAMQAAFAALEADEVAIADPLSEVGTTNFYIAYHGLDDRALQEGIAGFFLRACPDLGWVAPHCRAPGRRRDGPLRLGITSAYLHRHTIGKLNRGLIRDLSRELFRVTVLHSSDRRDAMADAIDADADAVVQLPPGDLATARERVAAEELDVLLYTDVGMDPLTYYLAFARLAPVQCVTWGHPDTTGIPNLDYFLSSDLLEPPGAEAHYSERLVRLAGLPTCYARPEAPGEGGGRAHFGLPADARLYVCVQNLFKLHPDFDAVLGAILERDAAGILVFIADAPGQWMRLFRDRFQAAFPALADRLIFLPRMAEADFLHLLSTADALLDPPHFSGGNTSFEAFAMGAPVVTWQAAFMRGRVSGACYRKMGFTDLVAGDADAFVELALRLANDDAWRRAMRARVGERCHVLFDDTGVVREMDRFFVSVSTP